MPVLVAAVCISFSSGWQLLLFFMKTKRSLSLFGLKTSLYSCFLRQAGVFILSTAITCVMVVFTGM